MSYQRLAKQPEKKNEVRCTTPYLDEVSVKERFTVAVNQLLAGRDATAYADGRLTFTYKNGSTFEG